ncbi:hypothetical protein [Desulfosporosinus sp. FKA]|uniref:hypothetical protein n=1 Tax=Desulfosporosinus sp. FKA TaxID=1969834 RepID=UPI000B49F6FD|nr:hypothetical protein [Desulfosporosinus sp. FKA]
MEWALGIPNIEKVYFMDDPWCENNVFRSGMIKEISENVLGEILFTRIYFGQEFCERSIPSLREVLDVYSRAREYGQELTLVTPYVTENGLTKLRQLLQGLSKEGLALEVVVNDWGILYLLNQEYPGFKPIIGRQLNKAWRDPRIGTLTENKKKSHGQKSSSLPMTSFESDIIQKVFTDFGVSHVELDIPPSGLNDFERWNNKVSLYFPYTAISSGRMCLLRSWGYQKGDKFKTTDKTCGHTCRQFWIELSDKSGQVPVSPNWHIVQKGNAIFCVFKEGFLKDTLNIISRIGIDRLIFQPEPI